MKHAKQRFGDLKEDDEFIYVNESGVEYAWMKADDRRTVLGSRVNAVRVENGEWISGFFDDDCEVLAEPAKRIHDKIAYPVQIYPDGTTLVDANGVVVWRSNPESMCVDKCDVAFVVGAMVDTLNRMLIDSVDKSNWEFENAE
jgi:hypothetical protein